ncbi:DUF6615 family protein [Dysgonomonas capnocytophagoides]|uniref:DUF6615 family protein n=1 Tax=Dysgonomonas capnocytophagoides TaxID=45254 RepID=UPI002926D45D|nr:hypothetical protein DCPSUM001_13770 [Dysgonomonas capnocytophagoides]
MTDCEKLRYASIYVKEWIRKQPDVYEESLTDWLLYYISDNINNITYKSFTRRHEGEVTGADWEWWFLYPHASYKFRVQAKMLERNNYKALNQSNRHGKQIDLLINDAIKYKFFPLYSFYTNGASSHVRCNKNILDEGVYLANAIELKESYVTPNITPINESEILQTTIPLSCLFCCPLVFSSFESFLEEYFSFSANEENKPLGKYLEIPQYVNSILNYKYELLPLGWYADYRVEFDGVKGIMIIDNRNNTK